MAGQVSTTYALKSGYDTYLELDPKKYRGMWIAIFIGKVVAQGHDPKQVCEEAAKKTGSNKFMLTKITSSQYEVL